MRKIPTVFVRDEVTNRKHVKNEVTPGCEWVLAGQGVATRKYDGTCVMFDGWEWYARREVKAGKTPPESFTMIEHDETTGKTVGWEPANQSGFSKWLEDANPNENYSIGTYELCGPKINGDPEGFGKHVLISHEYDVQELDDAPRGFASLGAWLQAHDYEGIVWHHEDGRMAKLKKRDFPRAGSLPDPVTAGRICDIDDCRRVASILVEGYPDDVALCDVHDPRTPSDMLLPWERVVRLDLDVAGSLPKELG